MSKNSVSRVATTVEGITKRIEEKADELTSKIDKAGSEALEKFDRLEKQVITPLEDANKALDELLFGSNSQGMTDEEMEAENNSPLG